MEEAGSDVPEMTTILAVRNVEDTIGKCIESLLNQTLPPDEIIVIDDGSEDETPRIVSKYPLQYFRIEHVEGFQAPRARAFGLRKASGENILLGEADAYYDPNFLEKCAKSLDNEEVGGTFGCMRFWRRPGDGLISTFVELNYLYYEKNPGVVMERAARGEIAPWVIKKEVLDTIKIWPESLTYGEDTYLARQMISAGFKISYTPDAYWYHRLPDTMSKAFHHRFNFGRHHPETIRLQPGRYIKPLLFRFSYFIFLPSVVFGSGALSVFRPIFLFPAFLILLLWMIPQAIRIRRLAIVGRGRGDLWRLVLYPAYSLLTNAAYFGGIIYGMALNERGESKA